MGSGGEVNEEDVCNSPETGNDVEGHGSDGVTVRERELGSDGGNAEGDGGVPTLGGPYDIRDIR